MHFQFDHWEISTDDLSFPKITKQRQVHYSNKCSVVLIPCRDEYKKAGIDLWYTNNDFSTAIQQVMAEVDTVFHTHPSLSKEQILCDLEKY